MKKPLLSFMKVAPVQIGGAWTGAAIANTAKHALGKKAFLKLAAIAAPITGANYAENVTEGIIEGLLITGAILSFNWGQKALAMPLAIASLFAATPDATRNICNSVNNTAAPYVASIYTEKPSYRHNRFLSCRIK